MCKYLYKKGLLLVLLIPILLNCEAQNKPYNRITSSADSIALFKEFIQACNLYKQVPLQLQLNILNSTNITFPQQVIDIDTVPQQVQFYLNEKASYVSMNNMEQYVSDSIAIIIINQNKRILLYNNVQPIKEKMNKMMGLVFQDSSILSAAEQFVIGKKNTPNQDVLQYLLESKSSIYNTNIPKLSIAMNYAKTSKNPIEVVKITRSLQALDSTLKQQIMERNNPADVIVQAKNKYYLLVEQTATYQYASIQHQPNFTIPFTVSNVVQKNSAAKYQPILAYKEYTLTQSNY